jgi:Ni/Co efflux regulator RcnB
MEFENNERGPRAVITVSGIPKDSDPVRLMRVLDDISESVYEKLESVEIGMVTNVPDEILPTGLMSPEDAEALKELPGFGPGRLQLHLKAQVASGLIFAATMMAGDEAAGLAWESKSEEEKEAIHEHNRQRSEHYERAAVREMQDKRTAELRQAFDIANHWAAEPDLTPMERCHGVAHDLYKIYGVDAKEFDFGGTKFIPDSMRKAYDISAGQAYARHYDTHLSEQIKERKLRAAKDLFGG